MTSTLPDVPEWASGGFPAYGALDVDDDRAAGQSRAVINWGTDDPAHDRVGIWGLSDIWNNGGTWDGPWTGWITGAGDHVIDAVWAGSGQYAGLALRYHAEAPRDDSVWHVAISIEPASGPAGPSPSGDATPVTGTRQCQEASTTGADFPPANERQGRAEFWLCTWDVSDDRLAGIDTTLANVDTDADGSVEGWGSISLRSPAGATDEAFCGWLGYYSLHKAADGSTTASVELTGIGTCEGLSYAGQETGTAEQRTVNGVISGTATNPIATASPSPRPTPRAEWPFVATMCPDDPGEPRLLVALGTSETAGWGIRRDESFSPQEAYPGQYADILCHELGAPVELRSYFPSQSGNQLAPLAWWIEKVEGDDGLRGDIAAADIVALWAMSSHDIVAAQFLPGACAGAWPNPLRACLEERTANIPAETDELFGLIGGLIVEGTTVLAGDAYAPPIVMTMPWWDEPYADEIQQMIDPFFVVEPMSAEHGFTFVDTELVFNGNSRRESPADSLFQSDGLHPTDDGALLTAQTYAEADGLDD